MRKSAFQTTSYSAMVATLGLTCLVAGLAPETALGQAAAWYGQNRAPYGHVPQARHYGHGYTTYPPAGHYGSPGYVQHPSTSQPAMRDAYHHGGYPAAANAAAAHRYGGTTAWTQPGLVATPYQNNSAYAPRQYSGYGHSYAHGRPQPYGTYGNGLPATGYPTPNHPAVGNWNQNQPGQNQRHHTHPHQQQNQQQLTPIQKAALQAAQNVSPNGVPVLSPAARQFFENLRGPNLSTYNQTRQNYSFRGQTRPSTQIPNTTWRSGSRFGQSYSNRSSYNQSTVNQNRFNYSLHNLTRPGLRGY